MRKRLQNLAESLGVVVALHVAAAPAAAQAPAPQAAQIDSGQRVFSAQCGFCHGRDAMGGETGPDLTRSTLVRDDGGSGRLEAVTRGARPDKGVPASRRAPAELAAVVAFIKSQKAKAESPGARRSVEIADLQT